MRSSAFNTRCKKRVYDSQGDYIVPTERAETKAYSLRILNFIESHGGWVSIADINRSLGRDHIRLLDAALTLLMDSIEQREFGYITKYRRCDLRRTPWVDWQNPQMIFNEKK